MEAIRQLGQYATLLYHALRSILEFSTYRKNLFQEFVKIGYESIPIIMLTGVFTGAVLTLQTAYQLDTDIYPVSIVGSIVGQSIIIELAAVIGALVLAGKVGARISTELGTMRVSEQIDALEVMGINSSGYLALPKIVAGLIMIPMLVIISIFLSNLGGVIAGEASGILTYEEYFQGARESFMPFNLLFSLIKAFTYSFIITSVSAFQGYTTNGGALEVGASSTKAVVYSAVAILFSDYLLAQILL